MEELFLPVLSHFQNGNFWTASGGRMQCRVDPGEEALTAQVWEGPWNQEDSIMEETRDFPLTDGGLEELRAWLLAWTAEMNARPPRTLAENLRRRDAVRAQRAEAAPEE